MGFHLACSFPTPYSLVLADALQKWHSVYYLLGYTPYPDLLLWAQLNNGYARIVVTYRHELGYQQGGERPYHDVPLKAGTQSGAWLRRSLEVTILVVFASVHATFRLNSTEQCSQ